MADINELWKKIAPLRAPEIVRLAAEASGLPFEEVSRRTRRKQEKLAIVTLDYAAFATAADLGVLKALVRAGEERAAGREKGKECGNGLKFDDADFQQAGERMFGTVAESRARIKEKPKGRGRKA